MQVLIDDYEWLQFMINDADRMITILLITMPTDQWLRLVNHDWWFRMITIDD